MSVVKQALTSFIFTLLLFAPTGRAQEVMLQQVKDALPRLERFV